MQMVFLFTKQVQRFDAKIYYLHVVFVPLLPKYREERRYEDKDLWLFWSLFPNCLSQTDLAPGPAQQDLGTHMESP